MPLGAEPSSVQRPFVRYAVEAGWMFLLPDNALVLRNGGTISPVLDSGLVAQLQKLNPKVLDAAKAAELVKRLVRVRPAIEGNLDAWESLRGLKTVFAEAEKRKKKHVQAKVFILFSIHSIPEAIAESSGFAGKSS